MIDKPALILEKKKKRGFFHTYYCGNIPKMDAK